MNPVENILWIGVLVSLIAIPLVPSLLVLRGQRFWAPWVMLGAAVVYALTLGSFIGVDIYLTRRMQELSAKGGAAYDTDEWMETFELVELVTMVLGGVIVLSILVYVAGLLGVAWRWKETFCRAEELEAKTAELARIREGR